MLCQNANHIVRRAPNLPDEFEYLFVPYSVFTVVRFERSKKPTWRTPHVVHLEAALDNLEDPPDDLPLAPWF